MPGVVRETLEERIARYERMLAKYQSGETLEAIGAAEEPPLTKQRVRVILGKRPTPVGRPRKEVPTTT